MTLRSAPNPVRTAKGDGMRAATHVLWLFVLSVAVAACAPGEQAAEDEAGANGAEETVGDAEAAGAALQDAEGNEVGEVTFTQRDDVVVVDAVLDAPDLAHGFHGFHVHEAGVCEADAPEGPFTTAGGHFNPEGETHSDHAGDMPSLYVTEDGTAELTFAVDRFEVADLTAEGGEDGTAVIVHADRDNFGHIPDRYESTETGESGPDEDTRNTGDAGDRALCGVVEPA
ncbi:superoxide dismutase family protein [Haloechinothrix sp. LS1_15]|uniref:superoxide dismutase family protein n=1 Tax=Haloechinothrix sp. LS1_15 TaxID=2652248 RepID=UPI0029450C24|nr:superoxide dismutase family protein [Haloechinothrix sp. LS1_15]MDV6014281.1 hypothetical protein [Haloechinothrix sp. LS1_15]